MSIEQKLQSLVSNPQMTLEEMFDIALEEELAQNIHTQDSIRAHVARMVIEGNYCVELLQSIEDDMNAPYFCHDYTAGSNVPATAIYTKEDMMECILYGYTIER